ncbi:MAG: Spo0E family sporulation regulatory protein-aspartic acid phosphatase [Eubacteriales bacterium]|nr:Spo0E family sporulation regulatory protein-aspartic acid phosphatase [Eubacteriales bacterium]
MERINERKNTNKKISILKSKLEKEMDKNPMDYEKILNISRQLDKLILSFYTDKQVKDVINN